MTATEAVEKHLSDDFRNLFLRHIPLGRMGLPEEIAEAVVYLASDASAYTTGQILTVSGGFGHAEAFKLQTSSKMAAVVVATIPVVAVYPFVQKYFITGVMVGSLKG